MNDTNLKLPERPPEIGTSLHGVGTVLPEVRVPVEVGRLPAAAPAAAGD